MKRHWGRKLRRPGRLVIRLLPSSRRSWGDAFLAEMDEMTSARTALRWLIGGSRFVVRGWLESMTGGDIVKTVLATLSVIGGVLGLFLIGLFGFTEGNPLLVLALGLGLVIQGVYTLAYMTGRLETFEPWSLRALLAGQTIALLTGLLGFVSSALYNINPPEGDYEYGPLTVGAVITVQAVTALWVYALRNRAESVQAPPI